MQRFRVLRLPETEQVALARQIALFLQQMHTIPLTAVETAKIQPSYTNRSRERWLQLYADVQEALFPYLMSFSREWVHQHFAPLVEDPDFMAHMPTFRNGDLAPYHLLYNPDTHRLNGIIDFGTAGIGDTACDIACLIDAYGETFVRLVGRHYPGVANLIERARCWGGTLELQWLLGRFRQPEDPSWLGVHIGRARDVLPVGSGW